MKLKIENHLNEEQILRAVVDIADLSGPEQAHLSSCRKCQKTKFQFEQLFQELGKKAAATVPLPKYRLPLVIERNKRHTGWIYRRRTPLGMAVTVLLLVFIAWEGNLFQLISKQPSIGPVLELHEAEALIQDVNVLAENALPPVYLELSKGLEAESDFDEMYIEYIIPSEEDESLSLTRDKKGSKTC